MDEEPIDGQEACVLAASFIHATRYFTMLDGDGEVIPYCTCCCSAINEAMRDSYGLRTPGAVSLITQLTHVFKPEESSPASFWWGYPVRQADGVSHGTVEQQDARMLALLLLGELINDGSIHAIINP